MTDTPPNETKPLTKRLTPSRRTLTALLFVVVLVASGLAPASGAFTGTDWSETVGGDVFGVAYSDGYVYATAQNNAVVKLDRDTGAEQWNVTVGDDRSRHTIDVLESQNLVIVGSYFNSQVYALSTADGSTEWSTSVDGAVESVETDEERDSIFVGTETPTLYKLDPADGSTVTTATPTSKAIDLAIQETTGNVYGSSNNGDVYGYDSALSSLWTNTSNTGVTDGIAVNETHVFAGEGSTIHVLESFDGSGVTTGTATDTVRGARWSENASVLVVGTDGNTVETYNSTDMSREDSSAIASATINDVDISQDTDSLLVFAGSLDNNVYSVGTDFNIEVPKTLSGTVTDQSGDEVEEATVEAVNTTSDAVEDTATTNETGYYTLSLKNGTYNVTASKDDYVNETHQVTIAGSDETQDFTLVEKSEALQIKTRLFIEHGETVPYEIVHGKSDGTRENVTASATVTSNDTSVVTVDSGTFELNATADGSVNERTYITATYTRSDGVTLEQTQNVTVANKTVANLDILPPVTRFAATLDDKTIQTILIATGVGVAAAILATSFAGIAAVTLIMVMGWVMGIVPDGLIMVTVLTAMFIGMNVAGNVDYTVRR